MTYSSAIFKDKNDNLYNAQINKYKNPAEKFPTEIIVTPIASAIPIIPNKLPCLEVSGEDKPLNAKINKIPEIR